MITEVEGTDLKNVYMKTKGLNLSFTCEIINTKYEGRDTRKVYAHIYIDDNAVTPLPHWNEIYQLVHDRLPTYADRVIAEGQL